MVGPQAEVGKDGEQVVENSPLHGLVGHPVGLPGEAVDLDRDVLVNAGAETICDSMDALYRALREG